MTHQEKLQEIYDALRDAGRCTSKKEFAQMVGVNYSTIVNAMAGRERYSSDKLVARAKALLLNDETPAPIPAPRKEVVIPADALELFTNLSRTVQQQAETIDRLLNGSETKKGAV